MVYESCVTSLLLHKTLPVCWRSCACRAWLSGELQTLSGSLEKTDPKSCHLPVLWVFHHSLFAKNPPVEPWLWTTAPPSRRNCRPRNRSWPRHTKASRNTPPSTLSNLTMATMWGKGRTAAICLGTVWGQRPMGPTQWAGGLDQRLVPRTQLLPGLSNKHRQLVWCLALFFLLKIRQCQWLERTT